MIDQHQNFWPPNVHAGMKFINKGCCCKRRYWNGTCLQGNLPVPKKSPTSRVKTNVTLFLTNENCWSWGLLGCDTM